MDWIEWMWKVDGCGKWMWKVESGKWRGSGSHKITDNQSDDILRMLSKNEL